MKSKPVFLYVKGSLDPKSVKGVKRAGYEPVQIPDFAQFRIVQASDHQIALISALETFLDSSTPGYTRDLFGRIIAKNLLAELRPVTATPAK